MGAGGTDLLSLCDKQTSEVTRDGVALIHVPRAEKGQEPVLVCSADVEVS